MVYLTSYVLADGIAIILYFISFHFILFLFSYILMLWVIMFRGYMVY